MIWFTEGFLFSKILRFSGAEVVLAALTYAAIFAAAVAALVRASMADQENPSDMAAWRYLSLAPMLVVIVGSFVSLPVLLLVAAAAKIGRF